MRLFSECSMFVRRFVLKFPLHSAASAKLLFILIGLIFSCSQAYAIEKDKTSGKNADSEIAQPGVAGVKFTEIQDLDPNKAGPNRPIKQKWAVVIGISSFKEKRLKSDDFFMVKSAKDFRDYLVDGQGGRFADKHVRLLTNQNATRRNIIDTLGAQWLGPLAKPDDLVVVYLSTNSFPTTDGGAFLCTYDSALDNIYATCISMKEIMKTLKENVKAERIVLVLQAPYSGAAELGSEARKASLSPVIDSDNLLSGSGFIIVSSSQPDQLSWSNIFSTFFIEALRKEDGLVSLGDAFEEAKQATEHETTVNRKDLSRQTPVLKADWRGNELILGAPAVEEAIDIPENIQGYLAAEAHYFRANDLVTKGNLDDAIVEYEKTLETEPDYADALADYATVVALKGDMKKSAALFLRAVNLRPGDSLYRTNYARVLARLGENDSSRLQLEEAYKLNPRDKVVLTALATMSLKEDDPERAVTLLTEAIELYPESSELHNSISYAFARSGNLKKAINHAQKAVLLDPRSVTAQLNLGSMCMAYGNTENALRSYQEALKLDPQNANAHYLLSQTLEKVGKIDKARDELSTFVKLSPDNDPRRKQAIEKIEQWTKD